MDAELVIDDAGHTRPLRQVVADLIQRLMPIADELGCGAELAGLGRIATEGPSYLRQRAVVARGGSLPDVVQALRAELTDAVSTELATS